MTKFILSHGCHRGTLTSRDTGQPQEFDTYDEAYNAYVGHRKFYQTIGYQIWFAEIKSPDGSKKLLESNSYY